MAEHLLILGAGKSSAVLIEYLAKRCSANGWALTVGDLSLQAVQRMTAGLDHVRTIEFNLSDERLAENTIAEASVVISLLPANLHPTVARYCLKHRKHLVTASYVSEEMSAFRQDAHAAGLTFLNECGLDPGIDHMSAMEVFDRIRSAGGHITGFRSFTGGLIAPETNPENKWRYKFTWNSRNVVMAGQGVAAYLEGGRLRRIPYQQLFKRLFPVTVQPLGTFDGYANRDSLRYREVYGLDGISTLLRGTLRFSGFCQAWDLLVQLGCCDDTLTIENTGNMTHAAFLDVFAAQGPGSLRERIAGMFGMQPDRQEIMLLEQVGLFSDELIGLGEGTPAVLLEHILNKRWKLLPGDRDLVVMWHQFIYELNGAEHEIHASLTCTGADDVRTAMARTVGLPLGMAAMLIAEKKIQSTGVCLPIAPEFYQPILRELTQFDIHLSESQIR